MFAFEQATSLEEDASCEKLLKTTSFYMVFACPCLRALFVNHPKILPNAHLERVARQSAFERWLLLAFKLQKPPREASRLLLEAPRDALGLSWALLSDSWGALGRSWGALGMLLAAT